MLEEVTLRLLSLFKKIPRNLFLPLGIGLLGLILFGYGLILYFSQNNNSSSQIQDPQTQVQAPTIEKPSVTIDVEGGVLNPGVFSLPLNSRVQDGLIAAGGFSANADRSFVEKNINLAAKITDGEKIYIPRVGEGASQYQISNQDSGIMDTNNKTININTAGETELDSLPGVGPATAQKIIQGRPYSSIQDLVTKNIVSQKEFEKIKGLVSN